MTDPPTSLPHPFFRPGSPGATHRIAPEKLRGLLQTEDPPLLLDVRTEKERQLARLPGDVHIPLSALAQRLGELPRERTVVAYDHTGADASRAAALLTGEGFPRAAALEGGIDGYSRTADASIPRYQLGPNAHGLYLQQMPRLDTGCLAYLVGDVTSHDAILIDPGLDVDPYLALLKQGPWHLRAIVETHTHADHLAGHAALHAKTSAPIYVSRRSPALYPHESLTEGQALPFGSEELQIIETPGHTRDHLSLKVRGILFTGDTLLIGSCGRTDLGGGSPDLLFDSLSDKLLRLPDDTEVYPAHFGPHHALVDRWVSSIGVERATNEALRQEDREAFIRYMTEGWPPKPPDFERIVRENLAP